MAQLDFYQFFYPSARGRWPVCAPEPRHQAVPTTATASATARYASIPGNGTIARGLQFHGSMLARVLAIIHHGCVGGGTMAAWTELSRGTYVALGAEFDDALAAASIPAFCGGGSSLRRGGHALALGRRVAA